MKTSAWLLAAALLAASPGRADDLRAGVLLQGGAPQPLGVQAFARIADAFGVGVGYAALPRSLGDALLSIANVNNAHLSSTSADLDLRWFPFHGSFFLGASGGRQEVWASGSSSGQTENIDVVTWFATPRLGWLFLFDPGFTLGFDAGVQLPVSSSSTVTPPGGIGGSAARSAADLIANTPLPSVHLRLGWLF